MNNNRFLVEDCYYLTPRDVGRRSGRVRKLGINILEGRDDISYWFDDMSNPTRLFVGVKDHEPQEFMWEEISLTFGERAYFYCPCGCRVAKLYIPPNGFELKCRNCHNLHYALTVLNKNSPAGRAVYQMNRLQKLANSRASMDRIFYRGEYTKRFKGFLCLCKKAGLDNIVKGAEDLKELING